MYTPKRLKADMGVEYILCEPRKKPAIALTSRRFQQVAPRTAVINVGPTIRIAATFIGNTAGTVAKQVGKDIHGAFATRDKVQWTTRRVAPHKQIVARRGSILRNGIGHERALTVDECHGAPAFRSIVVKKGSALQIELGTTRDIECATVLFPSRTKVSQTHGTSSFGFKHKSTFQTYHGTVPFKT
jgi:hypothetical protein